MDGAAVGSERSVFLNVPYDPRYERFFVTLISTLVSLGQTPRAVAEIPESGDGRLIRIYRLLASCQASVHDLSRVGLPPRFNMPFELGLAWALRARGVSHDILVLETRPHRLDRTLSDYKGHDPLVYHGRLNDLVEVVADAILVPRQPPVREIQREARILRQFAAEHASIRRNPFRRTAFQALVAVAAERAKERGWI